MITLFLLLPFIAHADWGLSKDFVVDSCAKKCVASLEKFRGRAQQTNGSAALTIWKVGTKRIVAAGAITPGANDLIKKDLDFHHVLFAEFTACAMEKDEPGHRISNCVEKIDKARWQRQKE